MMHVRFSRVAADPPVLAGCILGHLKDEARPVLESQHGSLGLSLLEKPGIVIFESFWATPEALWLCQETEEVVRGELARRVEQPVRAKDYEVVVFEREGPPGEAVRLTRIQVKPRAGVADVVDVYGDNHGPVAGSRAFPVSARDAAVRRPGRRAADQPDPVAGPGRPGGPPEPRRDVPGQSPGRRSLPDPRRRGLPPGVRLGAETGPGLVVKPRITVCHVPVMRENSPTATTAAPAMSTCRCCAPIRPRRTCSGWNGTTASL